MGRSKKCRNLEWNLGNLAMNSSRVAVGVQPTRNALLHIGGNDRSEKLTCLVPGRIWIEGHDIEESAVSEWVDQKHPKWTIPVDDNATAYDARVKPFKLWHIEEV
jgi:hypothetical protein